MCILKGYKNSYLMEKIQLYIYKKQYKYLPTHANLQQNASIIDELT